MKCFECGREFDPQVEGTYDPVDDVDVCLKCQREWAEENCPELIGEDPPCPQCGARYGAEADGATTRCTLCGYSIGPVEGRVGE